MKKCSRVSILVLMEVLIWSSLLTIVPSIRCVSILVLMEVLIWSALVLVGYATSGACFNPCSDGSTDLVLMCAAAYSLLYFAFQSLF